MQGAGGSGPTTLVRDQSNGSNGSVVGLQPDQHPSQSFTVGRTGILAGIAAPMFRYDAAATGDAIKLTLYRCSTVDVCGTAVVATATISAASLSTTFPAATPQPGGPGYFDLSAATLAVADGQIYRFRLDPETGTERKDFGVLATSDDAYARGLLFSQIAESDSPFLFASGWDLTFATFVLQ